MAIHNRQVSRFGGTAELRDTDAMEEVLGWPKQLLTAEHGDTLDVFQIAALIYSITASRRPFTDGNKRLGLALLLLTLRKNGWLLDITNAQAIGLIHDLSIHHMSDDQFVDFCRENSIPVTD